MDKDEYFKILEDVCIYNTESYLNDEEWTLQSGLALVNKKEEKEFTNLHELNPNDDNESKKESRMELNAMKYYE